MHVLHVERQRSWTGQVARQFHVLAGLHARGHRAGAVVHPGSELGRRARAAGIPVIELPMRGWRLYASALRLGRALRGRRVDVLHAHGARDHLLALAAARLAGIPHVVRTKHNHTRMRSRASRLVFEASSAVVAVSEYVRANLLADGLAPERVETIATGVDCERFQPRPRDEALARSLGLAPGDVVVGNVSSLHRRKGIDTFLRALARLPGRAPGGAPLRGLLVGGSHAQWRGPIAELGLADRVLLPGFHGDVPAALSLLDLYVLPTRAEALGTSVLEAMAMGLPVLVGDVGGLRESVTPETGVRLAPEDDAAFAAAMAGLLADPARARALGEAGRKRVEQHYSRDATVARTVALYERLLPRA